MAVGVADGVSARESLDDECADGMVNGTDCAIDSNVTTASSSVGKHHVVSRGVASTCVARTRALGLRCCVVCLCTGCTQGPAYMALGHTAVINPCPGRWWLRKYVAKHLPYCQGKP